MEFSSTLARKGNTSDENMPKIGKRAEFQIVILLRLAELSAIDQILNARHLYSSQRNMLVLRFGRS